MPDRSTSPTQLRPVRVDLQSYVADIQFNSLAVGVDNIHYDVFISPHFADTARKFIVDSIRQTARLAPFFGADAKNFHPPEVAGFRKLLSELLQATLTRAKAENNIELDLLFRVAILRFLTGEISAVFADQILECKERLRSRGTLFERSEQSHVLNARLAEVQADRRNVARQVGQQIHLVLCDLEDNVLAKLRRALFGDDFAATYELLKNRLLFVENGKDDVLFLEQYVLLGSFARDHDRFENINTLLIEFLGDFVLAGEQGREVSEAYKAYDELSDKGLATGAELARLEEEREALIRRMSGGGDLLSRLTARKDPAELRAALADVEKRHQHLQQKLETLSPQIEEAKRRADSLTSIYHTRLGDYLNEPSNARRLFDSKWTGGSAQDAATRERMLEEWVARLEQRELLIGVLAGYQMRELYTDYCPPVHLQQLKKALIHRDELKRVEDILRQFPARRLSARKIDDISKALLRWPREKVRDAAIRFAEDFMRLRRDTRNHERLTALMERINLVRIERTRELSRINNSLYELLLAEEAGPEEDRVISHVIIKADVRGSTRITHELLARGLNPASYFSMNLHEPVKKILERFGAAKVFIEGDAIILSILETQSNHAHQRSVARACVLAQQILTVSNAYNARVAAAAAEGLPRLELGVGVAYQDSAPAYWSDGDSRIMISKALNLSDRLSGCSKAARRMLPENVSPFNLFLFQTVAEAADEEEAEEFMIRYNLNGVQLNEEGFQKLQKEISLTPIEIDCQLPWGPERVTLYAGEILIGEVFEHIIVRKGVVRQLTSGKIGAPSPHSYYEVCTGSKMAQLLEKQLAPVRKA